MKRVCHLDTQKVNASGAELVQGLYAVRVTPESSASTAVKRIAGSGMGAAGLADMDDLEREDEIFAQDEDDGLGDMGAAFGGGLQLQ